MQGKNIDIDKKISVIIPIYNAEKYLRQTLDCIRFQTYKHLEIVCVLDYPTDNSAEIVKELAKEDNRIKLVEHSKNMGLPAARNSGVASATGEYIHFIDSDDLLSPDFYEAMVCTAEKTGADVTACSVFYENKPKDSIWFSQNEVVYGEDKVKKTKVVSVGWSWRYLIKKKFWDERNFSFPDLVPMEDTPVMIQMIYYADKVALCPQAVYFYKNRENSLIKSKLPRKDPKRLRRKKNYKAAHALCVDFIRKHKIKHPSKLEQKLRKHLTLRKTKFVCESAPTEYGKIDKKISVIIPIYNAEKYVEQTLNAVRFQTYKNLEIICVLDCPPDNSESIISEVAKNDERIKIVRHTKNMGPAAARNTGVKNAAGEYIHFMDSDDLLSPDFYDVMIYFAEKNSTDVAASSVYYEKKAWKSIWFRKSEVLSGTNDKIRKTEVTVRGWAWRYLIKKSFWTERNFSFPDLMMMEDTPVMISMMYYANKVALCPNATYFYMRRESSILNKSNDSVKEMELSKHRQLSRKMCSDFMHKNNIKKPNKLCYDIKKYLSY